MSIDENRLGRVSASVEDLPPHSKRCPRCGEILFDDMDVCFGCLYDFTREPYHLPEGMIAAPLVLPEVDDLEEPPEPTVPLEPAVQEGVSSKPPASGMPRPFIPLEHSRSTERRVLLNTAELSVGLPLLARGLTLGRASDNDIVLHKRNVAEHQLVLVPREDDVVALGLVAGAFESSDGSPAKDCAFLQEGDSIVLGSLTLELEKLPAAAP